MRFGLPRSPSPTPTRRRRRPQAPRRSTSSFGVPDSSSDEGSSSETETESSVSSSTATGSGYDSSASKRLQLQRKRRPGRTLTDEHRMDDMIASVRLRVTHHDAYEEWEQQTRKDAFLTARHEQAEANKRQREEQARQHAQLENDHAALQKRQLEEVQAALNRFRLFQQEDETKIRQTWNERERIMRERIEKGIKYEEEKERKRLEEERKKREEEERKRREEEERQRAEQERKLQEELRKRKEEEEAKKQKEREEEEKRKQEELEKQKGEQLKAEEEQRKALGMTTASHDWRFARDILKRVKTKPMVNVKTNPELKKRWSACRREIVPKIGQLTNDAESVSRITQQIIEIIVPKDPKQAHPKSVYFALLSSLSKAILMQAETEVTAEKRSAGPLGQVTANLLGALERFPDVFWAKLVQRAGPWPVPCPVPAMDEGVPWADDAARRKAEGFRADEGPSEYFSRVSGIMRVYFHILAAPVSQPIDQRFRLPRYWTYFARMVSEPRLLDSPVAPEVMHIALDVYGIQAKAIWGAQWVKLLELLYEGITVGILGSEGRLIGGKTPEGIAARVRLQLEIERIMSAN